MLPDTEGNGGGNWKDGLLTWVGFFVYFGEGAVIAPGLLSVIKQRLIAALYYILCSGYCI
jgi:hypothetical protein